MKSTPPTPYAALLRAARLRLEAVGARLLFALLGRLPMRAHATLARALTALLRRLPLRRAVVRQNLALAFPGLPPTRERALLAGIYQNTILFALELARMRRATPAQIAAQVDCDAAIIRQLDELKQAGTGFIIGCAHIGNWEWLGAWYALTRGRFGVVYKPMHNPSTDAFARQLREQFGTVIFSTRDRLPRGLFAHLRGGGAVAILADQDARKSGRFFPFFGHPASTATGLASLATRLDLPLLPGFCLRQPGGRFKVVIYPPLRPAAAARASEAARQAEEDRLTQYYLSCVEDIIRRAPEQYFWWHRRWKTQPPMAPALSNE
jgi:KDO2-lipid IV(A) lauroyltransferase